MDIMLQPLEREVENATINAGNETVKSHIVATAFLVCTIASQISTMLCMGAIIKLQDILDHFKRPASIFIALVAQFVVMPASAFGLINLVGLPPTIALSAMILASSPGGAVSNLFTHFFDGDVALSIMLTTMSMVLAIGFMPLNVWIYARQWEGGDQVKASYEEIVTTLAWMMIPLICGMIANRFTTKFAMMINRIGTILSIVLICISYILQYIMYPEAFDKGWKLWLIAMAIPTAGLLFGYFFAFISKLPMKECKTICIETGVQSVGLATTVVLTSFPEKMHGQMTPVLIMFGIYFTSLALILASIFRITKILDNRKSAETISMTAGSLLGTQ